MKKIFLLICFLVYWCLQIHGEPVKYVSCTPSSGSVIDKWDFTLTFDITDALASVAEGNYGLGYVGTSANNTVLYKGTPENGEQLALIMNKNFTAKSEGFIFNGNTISFSFDNTIPIEPGQLYSIKITNRFGLYLENKAVATSGTTFDFDDSFVLTFYGGEPLSDKLVLQNTSISNGIELDNIHSVSYSFNEPVVINDNIVLPTLTDLVDLSESTGKVNLCPNNNKIVEVIFEPSQPLYRGHTYSLKLPSGIVCLASNNQMVNEEIKLGITGNSTRPIDILSHTPENSQKGLFENAVVTYNLPEGFSIAPPYEWMGNNLSAKLYLDDIKENNLVKNLFGKISKDGKSLTWDLTEISYMPSSKYILIKDDNVDVYNVSSGSKFSEYELQGFEIDFFTPSVEESGIKPLEFNEPVLGKHGTSSAKPFTDGMSLESVGNFEIALKDLRYIVDDGAYDLGCLVGDKNSYGQIYEVNGDEETLISEFITGIQKRESPKMYYYVASAMITGTLYEGKTYRIVFPENTYCVGYKNLKNYLCSPELSYIVKGTAPTSLNVIGCTHSDNQEVETLYNVVWTISTPVAFVGDKRTAQVTYHTNNTTTTSDLPIFISNESGSSRVKVDCTSTWGNPVTVKAGTPATVKIPAGILCYISDPIILNKELSVTVVGKEKIVAPPVQEPEFIETSVDINGFHSMSLEAVKGRKISVSLIPDGNWVVTSLTRDGNDVLPFLQENDGVYTTPALTGDTKIEATIEYDGVIINDIASDVVEIPETSVKVYSDGEHIVVDGISAGDVVAVYSTNGMKIAEQTMNISDRAMQITIANGQIYIVRVNDKAVKIQH